MASAHQSRYYEQSQREERGLATQQHEESLRDMEQIRHTNATLDLAGSDAFRAQTEQAAIRIVTPHYKIPEKPGTDVQIGSSLQDLSSKLTDAADYRAERAAEHFRMQIIDPRVASHAHIPAHAIRDYARRHLIDDFPSLHGKRSFLDLEALDQLRIRPKGKLGDATDRDKDLDKFLKNRDGKPWELAHPPKVDDDSLRELNRLRNNIDNLQKIFSDDQQFPKEDSKSPVWRRNLFLVADEDGADICEWRFNIKEESLQKNKKMEQGEGGGGQQPWRGIETPTGQPTKSCLKQTPQTSSSPKQQIGNSSYSLHHVGTEPDGESWEDRGEISFDLDKQRLALIQQMQKNLEIHRKHQSPRRYPTVPFDGPFFRLEEVGNNIPGTSTSGGKIPAPPPPPPQGWTPRQSSSQIYEQPSPFNEEEEFDEASGGRVVYWPAPDPKSRLPKQAPPPPKNLRDPERLEEFLRQEQMQKEAEALRLQRETELRDRQRRESFIEKPEHPPEIQRLGRCWQPPLEQPFKWPTSSTSTQQPLSVQTGVGDAEEYRWAPLIREPTFKKETKRFTPEPESPPIRGHGTGPLDDVAKRQTAGLILPSPDGSHRPRTEFSHIRKPPAGGFMPHAPNVIRVSRAEGKAQKGEIGGGLRRHTSDMKSKEPIEREYLTHNNEDMNGGASSSQYQYNRQLPRHSSTIVQLGPLPRVEVRRRIKLLEARQQQTNHQRSRSAVSHARSGSSAARSPSAQRSLERIQRATAPSPAPASYARARRYIPTALPSGIRVDSDQMSQERPQIPPRHTRQMVEERSVVRVSPQAPIQRREVVRREVIKAPTTKHTVHRIEEKKRTEEVERRVVRRERRHKSRRVHRGYHSSGGYRSRSASRRSGYANGYSDGFGERHLPISYEGGGRRNGGFDSERHFAAQNGHARYGSVTDSLRRGDTKYMPNGELKINGTGTLKVFFLNNL
uniref:Uncharacterized protein n=1 Tax=Meloidogyne javanica TaxID=6303 RepID=A0A915LMT0_MELJA